MSDNFQSNSGIHHTAAKVFIFKLPFIIKKDRLPGSIRGQIIKFLF